MTKLLPNDQRGVVHLLPVLLLVVAAISFVLLISFGVVQNPFENIKTPFGGKGKEPTVSLRADYRNPFDKSNQYVNPFSTYKNPFDAIE